jgi:Na+/proline symporter
MLTLRCLRIVFLAGSAVGFRFGIAGPYAYAAGATVQILLFAILASNLKMKAPNAHTFLEIIGARWGTGAHLVFLFFGFLANVIVSTMLVLGGVSLALRWSHQGLCLTARFVSPSQSATVNDLTGMPTQAAVFLIPILVSFYVVVGGMRATLFADWSHTAALFILIWLFTLTVYVTSDQIGSPHKMYELLTAAAVKNPVEHNKDGSYLTFRSESALIFGVLNLVGNCG